MPRSARLDHPGCWTHATNRGIAKRPIFGGRREVRQFLAGLTREVRGGAVEVHGYSILTDHFNRRMRRDGPLFRGRFWSRGISTSLDWERVLRYIDQNPVKAGLVDRPEDYPYGSAFLFSRGKTPPWLEDSLVGAAPASVRDWMERKARLADGKEARSPIVSVPSLMNLVEEWGGDHRDALLAGLLTTAGGLGRKEAARVTGVSASTVHRRATLHRELLGRCEAYGRQTAEIVSRALRRDHAGGAVTARLLGLEI